MTGEDELAVVSPGEGLGDKLGNRRNTFTCFTLSRSRAESLLYYPLLLFHCANTTNNPHPSNSQLIVIISHYFVLNILVIIIVKTSMANNYDFMFKFIIIGDSSVGKSCLLLRFTEGRFKKGHEPTLGVQFGSRSLPINGYTIKVQVWDTAGQESFKSITRSYYKSSIAAFLVFDLTKRDSFESIGKWMMEVKNNSHDRIQTVLIGNKLDLKENREVSPQEAQKFADANGLQYFQTSAQSGIRVQDAFKSVTEKIVKMINSKQINPESQTAYGIKRGKKQRSSSVSPTKSPPEQGKSNLQVSVNPSAPRRSCCRG